MHAEGRQEEVGMRYVCRFPSHRVTHAILLLCDGAAFPV